MASKGTTDGRAMQARNEAIKDLCARHADEWKQLFGDKREAKGLPREQGGMTAEQKQTRIAKHIKALRELGIEVPTTTND